MWVGGNACGWMDGWMNKRLGLGEWGRGVDERRRYKY